MCKNRRFPTVTRAKWRLSWLLWNLYYRHAWSDKELAITPIGLFWGLFSAVTYALYILLPAKAIEKWGSLIVIGLGLLLGG